MISIDTVYQKVLALANKEQRGYITPQEFNLFADQAQKEIFEQYFYDLNQFNRTPGNSEEYSDITHNLNEKISFFEGITNVVNGVINAIDLYRLGTVIYSPNTTGVVEIEEVQQNELLYISKAQLTKPSLKYPVYTRQTDTRIAILPIEIMTTNFVTCTYVKTPNKPSWGYSVVGNKALYDNSNTKTTNFELHPSEESELVYKILKFAGISMDKINIMRAGQVQEQAQVQQEKQ